MANLLTLVELFQGKNQRLAYEKQYLSTGIGYRDLKNDLAKAIFKELQPIQEKRKFYEGQPELVKGILADGQKHCSRLARSTLAEVKRKMGLIL